MTRSVFTDKYERLRKLLVDARRSRGISQAEVASQLRRPQSFVSKYERGERRLDVIEFMEVTRVLAVDPCKMLQRLSR